MIEEEGGGAGHDELVPEPRAAEEIGVVRMTLRRWDTDPRMIEMGWPPPVLINRRRYRSRRQLEKFKAEAVRRAAAERGS